MGLVGTVFGTPGEAQPAPERYIRNTLTNRQLYQKAYMIEFYGDDEDKPTDVFTFSIPPETEELTYTQRKTETKVFKGLHVDEYGADAEKIVLSGSTVNQSLKMIYRGEQSSKWLSGEEEIYYLRDLLRKYRSLESLQKATNGKIIIYDLSKTYMNKGERKHNNIKNYWQAFPGDFKIRRSSDKPFVYKYSFEFTGVLLENFGVYNSHGAPPELAEGKAGLIQNIMDGVIAVMDFVDGINAWVNNVLDKANQVSRLIKLVGNALSYSLDTLTGIIDSVGDTAAGFIDGATTVVEGASSIIALPRTIEMKAVNLALEVVNATKNLCKACDELAKNCHLTFSAEGYRIPQEVLDQFGMNDEEFKDSVTENLDRAQNAANELASAAKSAAIPDITVGNPDPETGEQRIVLSYGYSTVTLNSTDTLESLANKYLGSPDKAIDIATFNGAASLNELEPGAAIRLPVARLTRKMTNNRIYARREDRDNYGRDILLTDDGRIVTSASGDYELTSGVENLSQAVLLRLRESVAKRIRMNAYGIRTNISDPTAGKAYILSSIELTVGSDPRVSSVDDIRFTGAGDSMNVAVVYSDINSAGGNAEGRV